eukprot:CAMPEP_0174703246 /NCGR_PEP_ID=MMETSP1094-20130205/7259_1 /TAXON_ID=156173 /ORGANISM="Chrysochromulina brevifilum, Strain UTEX LB 985" /LENGTH=148 /DNA_ID=CAMNT_0015901133 /DNA_START=172 /DNA_END=615 /DNA_ORIENTATION=+
MTAAPNATASSGLTEGLAVNPVIRLIKRPIHGMRVAPPTKSTLEIGTSPRGKSAAVEPVRCCIRRHRHATCCCHCCTRGGAYSSSPLFNVPILLSSSSMPPMRAASRTGGTRRSSNGLHNASNLRRERVTLRPSLPLRKGTSTCVVVT